jgi:hypothetical protein
MIDMNRSIEDIMNECDYIAEVKGEAEANYGAERRYESRTHNHRIGGKMAQRAHDARTGNTIGVSHDKYKPMKTAGDYIDRRNNAKKLRASNHKVESLNNTIRSYEKSISSNESASIFDDLLDLV